MNKDRILELFSKLRSILEDRRPSHEVGPLGAPFFIVESTVETVREEGSSEAKRDFVDILMDILKEASVTPAMKAHIVEGASAAFNFGLPADYILWLALGRVDQGEWGLFDPEAQPQHEKGVLDATIRTLYLNMLGANMVFLSQEQEDGLSLEDIRNLFLGVFAPERWPTVTELSGFFERMGESIIRTQWVGFFRRARNLIQWIEQFRQIRDDSGSFQDEEPTLRRLARYASTFK